MKLRLFCVVAAVVSGLAVPSLALAQSKPPEKKVILTGKLAGGRIAIGGETSGWELAYKDETGEHTIEVELSKALLAKVRDGQMVRITGTIVTRQRVERGSVRTLVASAVDNAPVK